MSHLSHFLNWDNYAYLICYGLDLECPPKGPCVKKSRLVLCGPLQCMSLVLSAPTGECGTTASASFSPLLPCHEVSSLAVLHCLAMCSAPQAQIQRANHSLPGSCENVTRGNPLSQVFCYSDKKLTNTSLFCDD